MRDDERDGDERNDVDKDEHTGSCKCKSEDVQQFEQLCLLKARGELGTTPTTTD